MTYIKRRVTKVVQFIKQNNETESDDYDSDDSDDNAVDGTGRENIEMSFSNASEKSKDIELSNYINQRQKEAELSDITRAQYYDSFTPLKMGAPEDAETSNFATGRNIKYLAAPKAKQNYKQHEVGKFSNFNTPNGSENMNDDTRKMSVKGVNKFGKNAKGRDYDPTPQKKEVQMITASIDSEIIIPHQLIEKD